MQSIVGFIILCISSGILIITAIIDIFIIIKIIISRQRKSDTTIVTVVNTYLCLLFSISVLIGINLASCLGDLNYRIFQDSIVCYIFGHLFVSSQGYLMNSFPLEAFARLSLIMCRPNVWQRSVWTVFGLIIVGFVYSSVVYVLGIPLYNLHYIPTESACGVDILAWKGMLYIFLLINTVSIVILNIIYHFVLKHMRQSSQATQNGRQTNTSRDMYVIKRIVMIMIIAIHIGIPPTLLWIISSVTYQLYPLSYRIGSLCFALCNSFISVGLALTNPCIKSILWRAARIPRIEPMAASNKDRV